MNKCIFCSIIEGTVAADIIYENEFVIAFRDMYPQAPFHVLIIPRKHISSVQAMEDNDSTIEHIFSAIRHIAHVNGLDKKGYRLVTNHGESAGQSVFHVHFHLIGGRDMKWPPG